MADCPSVSLRFSFRKRDPNAEFCVSLCLGLVFIVCMYYVTVIALSHHVSVVMCFVHMIIIIIIIIIIIATSPGVEVRKYWHVDFDHRIWRSTAVIVVKFEGINSKYRKVRDIHSTAEIVKFERKWRQLKIKSNHWQNYSHSYSECSKCLPLPTFPPNNDHNWFRIKRATAKKEEDEFFFEK